MKHLLCKIRYIHPDVSIEHDVFYDSEYGTTCPSLTTTNGFTTVLKMVMGPRYDVITKYEDSPWSQESNEGPMRVYEFLKDEEK